MGMGAPLVHVAQKKKCTCQFLSDWSVHSKLLRFLQEAVTSASEHLKLIIIIIDDKW